MILVLLAGCSPTPPNAPETTATSPAANGAQGTATPTHRKTPTPQKNRPITQLEVTASDLEGLEVVFWHSWDGQSGEVLNRLVEEFNRENKWAVRVRAEYQGTLDQLDDRVRRLAEVDQKPTLVAAYLYQALNWDRQAQLTPLDMYVNDPLWGLSEQEQADFYPTIWQADVIQGERWGVPAFRSGQFLYYNETWGRELGFNQAPQNWDQLEQQVCAAAKTLLADDNRTNDGRGGAAITTDYSASLSWMAAAGAQPVAESGEYQFDTPQVVDTFEALRKLAEDGCAWLVEGESPVDIFASRQSLITTGSLLEAPALERTLELTGSRDRWRLLPFIGAAAEATFLHYGPDYVILSSTPEEELAGWVFVRWMLSPERQARWIAASGGLPLQRSAAEDLSDYANRHPHWGEAVALLPGAQAEPTQASWKTVRWAVSDATVQLFRYYFSLDQVPELAELLDETAQELNAR